MFRPSLREVKEVYIMVYKAQYQNPAISELGLGVDGFNFADQAGFFFNTEFSASKQILL